MTTEEWMLRNGFRPSSETASPRRARQLTQIGSMLRRPPAMSTAYVGIFTFEQHALRRIPSRLLNYECQESDGVVIKGLLQAERGWQLSPVGERV